MEIMAAHKWANNSELMLDVQKLGFLDGMVLDATFGLGRFWTLVNGVDLTTNDLYTEADYNYDFTALPGDWEGSFDSVVFDAPYKLNGTPTPGAFDTAYGVHRPATIEERLSLMIDGAIECLRVVKKGGFLLVKCQDQVSSGRMHFQTDILTDAIAARKVAQMHLLTNPRPQPKGRRQLHPRSNFSSLMIFKKNR